MEPCVPRIETAMLQLPVPGIWTGKQYTPQVVADRLWTSMKLCDKHASVFAGDLLQPYYALAFDADASAIGLDESMFVYTAKNFPWLFVAVDDGHRVFALAKSLVTADHHLSLGDWTIEVPGIQLTISCRKLEDRRWWRENVQADMSKLAGVLSLLSQLEQNGTIIPIEFRS
ncbi:uncharacterized protein LY89DRAFT_727485 [Mollisia scopiformis]|uniref:Uncharacterized protein n=1 Tax=Mollisia scopiformis TaxID=149040 RepID=A0A194XVX5_MOLSC|nr:uncharacterized protein LY89DRAFT_727485 [Mollisia scopiformis]KUJ24460.1 hypothetical protein LY89DRAFT_727485 [Mollisia scopiformis]